MELGKVKEVLVPIQVIIGETALTVAELSQMCPGSIVELDKLAGEPVVVTAAGRPVAHAEVVVIDENFGFRVTEILSEDKE